MRHLQLARQFAPATILAPRRLAHPRLRRRCRQPISEHVLHKPGPLTEAEFRVMREHPEIGERICDPLRMSRDFTPIIRHQHERWDGAGYPDGLKGEGIPLGARIVALADAFDAIVRGRPYRAARTVEEAIDELIKHSGKQFDPALVPLFIEEADRLDSGIAPSVELPPAALLGREAAIVTGARAPVA